jgi:hypothetical protein
MNHETHVPGPIETGIDILVNLVFEMVVGNHEDSSHQHQPIHGVLITGDGTQLPLSPNLSQHSHRRTR